MGILQVAGLLPRATLCASALALAAGPVRAEPGVTIRAQLMPRYATVLSSEIAGKIASLPFREGEAFTEGQEIAALDCSSYRARLQLAEAKVGTADRKLEAVRVLDQRKAVGKIDLDLATIDLDAARAEEQLAAKDVSRCTLLAPFSGRVAELRVKRHQFVSAGEPVIDILNERELELELLVPSQWVSWLRPGAAFSISLEEMGRSYPAQVTRIVPRIDPVSQTVKLFGSLTGNHPELVAGMSGAATFTPPAPSR